MLWLVYRDKTNHGTAVSLWKVNRKMSTATGRRVEVEPLVVVVGAMSVGGWKTEGVRVMSRATQPWFLLFRWPR